MTNKALIRRLQISCLGLDPIDPLRLLVDDVIEALAQTQRTWVGLTDEEYDEIWRMDLNNKDIMDMTIAKLKELNT
jgi:hypothetical protein